MLHHEEFFKGHGGLSLFEQSWLPKGRPRGVVVHVHGLIEHSGRYVHLAQSLAEEGLAVYAMDLRGHGRSQGPRCDVASFDHYLLDLDFFFRNVRARQPSGPIFLMGNSMGGLIATLWAIRRDAELAGLILSGPLFALSDEMFPRLRNLAAAAARLAPWLRFPRIPIALLSRSPEALASYRQDPLFFRRRFTVRVAAEILRSMEQLQAEASQLRVPLLLLQGNLDRICSPDGSRKFFKQCGSQDKTLNMYEGMYHEVFEEPEREKVLADLITWLNRKVGNGQIIEPSIKSTSPVVSPDSSAR